MFACSKSEKAPLFELLTSEKTGIDFNNQLTPTGDLNIFRYMYFYNGGGVGAGDFNNDGLVDLFFSSNQGANELYLNLGNLKFKNITEEANIKSNKGWSTGVSIVDINQDGLLDIYVSQVGEFEVLKGKNQLFICTSIDAGGIPKFEEQGEKYGLDLVGFGTQAAFLDYDLDGDLDFFQLNHSVHQNGTFGKRENFIGNAHPLAGDRFFENQNGIFYEKSESTGIFRNALGYGLGLAIGDINLDGYPDIYVGNDFHENDYLYINQGNKTFKDELAQRIQHTSRFSMGVDIADINNDIFPEIVSLDMLPFESEILKRSEGEDAYYNFEFKLKQGYNYQFARNNLQLNNGDGTFAEIGMFAGIHATDWSWSSLFLDFDKDGNKDLFISNGINKRMNDTDYINFVSSDEIQQKISEKRFDESDESLVDLIPEIKIPNKFYLNQSNLQFKDIQKLVKNNLPSFSNGAISIDLDNDGDLDIVTNNINDLAFIYENKSNELYPERKSLSLHLKGSSKNLNAIGAKIIAFEKGKKSYFEKFPVKGFQSSSEGPTLIAYQKNIDSLWLIWPDQHFQSVTNLADTSKLTVSYSSELPIFDYKKLYSLKTFPLIEISETVFEQKVKHEENTFIEFDREALIPFKMSTEGPAIAVGDINGDQLEDFFMGAGRKSPSKVFTQTKTGKFIQYGFPILANDSLFEDVDALILDFNKDGLNDIFVLSAGNEYLGKSKYNTSRLYINLGNGEWSKKAFPTTFTTAKCVRASDVDNDGDVDLFMGSQTLPWNYGKIPPSFLMINDGKGNFTISKQSTFESLGMIKDAQWVDFDLDGDDDLFIASEWDHIYVLENNKGVFETKKSLNSAKGWWSFLLPIDLNNDGNIDFIVGNHGQNSRLQTNNGEKIKMYVNDFDNNDRLDQIITYVVSGKETIFADKKEIEKQLPYVRKEFNLSKDFAKADIASIFGKKKWEQSVVFEADYFDNAVLWNRGNGVFELASLPPEFQYTPYYAGVPLNSGKALLMGNFYDANIQMGRYDADKGTLLSFSNKSFSKGNLDISGQVRKIAPIKIGNSLHYLIGRNNENMLLLKSNSIN